MFDRNRSGQALFFPLVSAISGNPVTGQVAGISGRVSLDGGSMAVVAGVIDEPGGGQYRLLPFAADTNGNSLGFYFTASGCVPVSFTVITQQNVSGKLFAASGVNAIVPPTTLSGVVANSGLFVTATATVASGELYLASGSLFRNTFASGVLAASGGLPTAWGNSGQVLPASGANAVVPPASLSGVVANSGLFVSVPLATISGVNIASGQSVVVFSGQLSGQQVTLTSGMSYTASGINVTATATVASGSLYLASGSLFRETFASGVLAASGGLPTAWGNSGQVFSASGANVVATATVASGELYLASGSLFRNTFASGVLAASGGLTTAWGNSGQSMPASGANVTVPIASISGTEVVATATVASGSLYLASGSLFRNTFASGVLAASGGIPTAWGNSGQVLSASGANVTVPPTSISGTNVVVLVASISGVNAVVPVATLSGVVPASGASVIANSGLFVSVPPATLSGVVANSGLFANVPINTISGVNAVVPPSTLSGVVANSGLFATVPTATLSGITLASGNIVAVLSGTFVTPWSGRVFLASGTGTSAVVDSGSIAQIATTLLTVDVSGAIELNAAKQSLGTMVLKQTSRFDSLASGLTSGMAVTYFCDGTTVKIMQPVVTTLSGRPIRELGVGQ